MTIEQLDSFFPNFIFFYGALMTFVLNFAPLQRLAEKSLPPALTDPLKAHSTLAFFCLVVGGLWTLQNIWLS